MSSENEARSFIAVRPHRRHRRNEGTCIHALDAAPPLDPVRSPRSLFLGAYARVRRALARRGEGLGVVAVDRCLGFVAGAAWRGVPATGLATLTIGRHEAVDLVLDGDPQLSLRHLLVLMTPPPSASPTTVTYRVVDLRSQAGLHDERGRPLLALEADGPAILSCGAYQLFFLRTGPHVPWPESPAEAWDALPERVYVDAAPAPGAHPALASASARARSLASPEPSMSSCIIPLESPVWSEGVLVGPDEAPLGQLHIKSGRRRARVVLGPSALDRGVLLGRYPRCNAHRLLQRHAISRVHLLVLRLHGRPFAIDCGSSNGIYLATPGADPRQVPHAELTSRTRLLLADDTVRLTYRPA